MRNKRRWDVPKGQEQAALIAINEICDGDRNAKQGFFFEVPMSDLIEIYEQIGGVV